MALQRLVGSLDGADLGVLAGYFVIVFAVGIWVRFHYLIFDEFIDAQKGIHDL